MMKRLHSLNLPVQFVLQIFRQDSGPVLTTLTAPDKDESLAEIHILNTQADTLQQAQAAAIEQFCHQGMLARHRAEQTLNLRLNQHSGRSFAVACCGSGRSHRQGFVKNIPIEKNQGVQGLSLGGSGHLALGYEMGKKSFDILCPSMFGWVLPPEK